MTSVCTVIPFSKSAFLFLLIFLTTILLAIHTQSGFPVKFVKARPLDMPRFLMGALPSSVEIYGVRHTLEKADNILFRLAAAGL